MKPNWSDARKNREAIIAKRVEELAGTSLTTSLSGNLIEYMK